MTPKSDIIWNVATAVPPRDLLPTMSATAACCGEMKTPVAAPVTRAAARNTGNEDVKPTSDRRHRRHRQADDEQLAPAHPVGQIAAGDDDRDVADRERRQRQSGEARRRDPAPPRRTAGPARCAGRTPPSPVAKLENSAADRPGCATPSAARRRLGLLASGGASGELRRLTNTTAAATSSATP